MAYSYQQIYPQYNYPMPQQTQAQQTQIQPQMQMQIQNGGLVSVHNETEARNYPIAIGTSITFKDENAPYVYTKTMGFSQLESPRFDKYRLVKEEVAEQTQMGQIEPKTPTIDNSVIDDLKAKIDALENEIEGIKKKMLSKQKKEVNNDPE